MICLMYYGELREITGLQTEEAEACNLGGVFRHIAKVHGRNACSIAKRGLITVNGRRVNTRSEKLSDGNVVCFFPVCIGG